MWAGRPPLVPGGRGRRGGYGRGMDSYAILLFAQLAQQIMQMENKPPVTMMLLAANVAIFFRDLMPEPLQMLIPPLQYACLQPRAILKGGQWSRLFWSAWIHADEYHLYYNMSSLLWKGVRLESRMGSAAFAALTAELLVLSHGMVVAGSWVLAQYIPEYRGLYLSTCAVGFSAVLFAYKVVLNHDDPSYSSVLGFSLPTKYMAWAELILASAFNPRASFFGHLCGIAAGAAHVAAAPAASAAAWRFARALRSLGRAAGGAAPRFVGGGASGGAGRPGGAAGRTGPPGHPGAAAAGRGGGGIGGGAAAAPRPQALQQQAALQAAAAARTGGSAGPAGGVAAPPARPLLAGTADSRQGAGRVTGGAAAISEEELRQRRLARFQR